MSGRALDILRTGTGVEAGPDLAVAVGNIVACQGEGLWRTLREASGVWTCCDQDAFA